MKSKFRFITRALFFTAVVAYPAMIFFFLVILKMPIRVFSLFVMAFALIAFITGTSKKKVKNGPSRCSGLPYCFSAWEPCAL